MGSGVNTPPPCSGIFLSVAMQRLGQLLLQASRHRSTPFLRWALPYSMPSLRFCGGSSPEYRFSLVGCVRLAWLGSGNQFCPNLTTYRRDLGHLRCANGWRRWPALFVRAAY